PRPDPVRERRGAFTVEIALEAVADRLVEQDAGPARAEDDRHRAGGRVVRVEVDERLARRLARETLRTAVGQHVEREPSAPAVAALLALAVPLHDAGDAHMDERPDVAHHAAIGGDDEHDAVLDP